MALKASNFNITWNGGESNAVGLVTQDHSLSYAMNPNQLSDGTGTDQAQKMITLNPTISSSGTTYDLTAIAGGPNNATVNFANIRLLIVENTSATISITLGNAAATIWESWTTVTGSTYSIPPKGSFIFYAPATTATVDSTHKLLKLITPSSTAVAKIIVVGPGA